MKNAKNIEFFNRDLLAKYLCNEVSPVEKLEVEAWLNQYEENREELEQNRKMLAAADALYKAKNFDSVTTWNNIKSKIQTPQSRIIQLKHRRKEFFAQFYKYAAIIVVAVLLGTAAFYFGFRNNQPLQFAEVTSAEKQVINEFILPDGSVVSLNSNSKLVFPKEFSGDTREVTIFGEAFFNVKPDASKPFIINAGNAQVKVVGTSFNVSAYPETETVEVVVATGKVQVTGKNTVTTGENSLVLLVPGEKGTYFKTSSNIEKTENKNLNFLAWKTHDFVFNDTPLNEVFQCLEKTYNVKIEVSDGALNDLKLNAHFDKKSIDFILDVVRLTFNLELSEENEQFTFSGRINN